MADKEERIWLEFDIPKPKGAIEATRCTTMTRQEAIEKMAKAIFTQIWGLPNNRFDLAKSSVKVRNRKLAEAALNALLEDKK